MSYIGSMEDLNGITFGDDNSPLPVVSDDIVRKRVLEALIEEIAVQSKDSVEVRAGAVWVRKGWAQFGSVSDKVAKSSYRENDDPYLFQVSVLIQPWDIREVTKEVIEELRESDEQALRDRLEKERQQKLSKAEELREAAAKLEAEAAAI